jgi:hypothetical protein
MAIQQFYTQAVNKDFARVFQFRVMEFPGIDFKATTQLLYVETANLPGRTINNVQVPYMGLQFNVPGTASYPGSNAYNLLFRMDADYDIRAALEASNIATFDDNTSTGAYNIKGTDRVLQLALLGKNTRDGEPEIVRNYTLYGAYLVSVADTQYDIKDTGTVATCQATIAYHYWRAGNGPAAAGPTPPNNVTSTLATGAQARSIYEGPVGIRAN